MNIQVNHSLDAKGLACPMPIIKTKKRIKELVPGEVLEVLATDQGSKADIRAWAKSTGEHYLGTIEENGVLKHYLRKAKQEEISEPMTYEKIVSLEELKASLERKSVTVIDVREPAEYAFSHIPEAISIPLGEIDHRAGEINKEDKIYVICRTGSRSDYAAKILDAKGYNVFNVVPGMIDWDGPTQSLQGGKHE
ncbi:sulfurtransferase TusA family protein [Virgibacillus sp. W0430]|uniref:sulfurtransferase TusA family protein n=1 Tax=Virgibacillus sp. W0430 TaxID=3391580 RepID=UPI003F45B875